MSEGYAARRARDQSEALSIPRLCGRKGCWEVVAGVKKYCCRQCQLAAWEASRAPRKRVGRTEYMRAYKAAQRAAEKAKEA